MSPPALGEQILIALAGASGFLLAIEAGGGRVGERGVERDDAELAIPGVGADGSVELEFDFGGLAGVEQIVRHGRRELVLAFLIEAFVVRLRRCSCAMRLTAGMVRVTSMGSVNSNSSDVARCLPAA